MCFVAVVLMRFFAAVIIWLIVVLSASGSLGIFAYLVTQLAMVGHWTSD